MISCEFCYQSYQQKHECKENPIYHIKSLLRYIINDQRLNCYAVNNALKFLAKYQDNSYNKQTDNVTNWKDVDINKVEDY